MIFKVEGSGTNLERGIGVDLCLDALLVWGLEFVVQVLRLRVHG